MGTSTRVKQKLLLFASIFFFGSDVFAQPCSTTTSWAVINDDVYLLNTGVTPFTQTAYNNVLPGTTMANAFVSSTGFMYSVTTTTSPTLYRYNTASPATAAVNTSFALPTINATNAGTDIRYQSGGQDADGNVYFATNNGRLMVKIDPVSGTTTTIWSATNPLTTVGPDFYSGGAKNFVIDGNGDFVILDAVSMILYTVPKTGGTATARGAVTGLPGGYDATDVFFANARMYVTSGGASGSYPVDMNTLAAGSIAGSLGYQDISTGSCAALTFPPLTADLCPTSTLYATNASGSAINTLNASTYAVVSTRSPITNTFSISLNGTDGKLYYATNAAGVTNPPLYVFDPVTNLTYASGCTLPTLASGRFYLSAGSDGVGNLYFTTERGQAAYRINPATCTVTTLWNDALPVINDPKRPASINFMTDYKDMVTDATGNLIFVDNAAPYSVWIVDPTTRQATYRGNLTGISGSIGDVFFKGGNLFIVTGGNGIYQINSNTLACTSVSSYNSAEIATAPCEAGTLPALEEPDGCVTNVIYTGTNNIQQVNATTFAPIRTYALPITNVSIAFASTGYVYTVTSTSNPTNPVIYGLNPSTGAVFATTCTLPSLTGGRYYISGASDAEGNIYFSSDRGHVLVKVNPETCAQQTVWSTTLTSSGAPAGVTFNQDYKDLTIDRNGDYYFVDDINHHVWQVKKGTTTGIYRGKITGIGSRSISDLIFFGSNIYATTSTISNPGVFQLNPDTYVATQVASYAYYDAASAPCAALTLGLQISGNILNDGNGNTDNTVSTSGTGAQTPVNGTSLDGTPLYVTMVNISNTAVATVPVLADGTYSFPSVIPGTYSVVLSTISTGTNSADSPLPAGWDNSGEQLGTTNGGADGTPNGVLGNIVVTTANVTNANFGINKKPTANPGTIASTTNPGGSTSVPVTGSFGGIDPEGEIITSLTITNFPSGATSITIGATTYTVPGGGGPNAWTGPVSVPTNSTGLPNSAISVDPVNGTTTVAIPFTVTDNAGLTSSGETLNVPFSAPPTYSIAGSIFNDNDGTTGSANGDPVNGSSSGTDPLDLIVNLYDEAAEFIRSAPVLADGTYSLSGVPAGNSYQLQLNTADNVGQSGENISDNLNADLTGNFVHVSNSHGVTPTAGINILDITSNVTGSNFGINEGPTAQPGTIASSTNPGSTTSVPVTSSFGGTDPNNGAITSLTITNFPTGVTSITIGGTTYTAPGGGVPNAWTGPVTVPTNTTGIPTTGNEISVDPLDGSTTVAVPFTVTDNAGLTSSGRTLNVPFTEPTYTIYGTIYIDANGQTGGADGSIFDGIATPIFVNLYEQAGSFIARAPVAHDGTYSFKGIKAGTGYQVQVSSVEATTGTTLSPDAALPGTYGNISSNGETNSHTDGIITFDIVATNVTGMDFGIQRPPVADVITNDPALNSAYSATPPTDFPIVSGFLSIRYSNLDAFSGTDSEDPSVPIAGNTIKIGTSNPNTKVYYNFPVGGAREVTVGEEIPNFDPAKLVFYAQIGSGNGSTPFGFTYSIKDAANVFSSPAGYTFSTSDPLPVTLSSFTAKKVEGLMVRLEWATTAETNSERFDVEHSTDAKIWNIITVIAAKGESNRLARYNYTHTKPVAGQNLYRLKMIDRRTDHKGASFAYSSVTGVTFEGNSGVTIYPNPVSDKLRIKHLSQQQIRYIEIIDLNGKTVYELKTDVAKVLSAGIDVTRFVNGPYVIRIVQNNGAVTTSKVFIAH
jgi:hypothetical protein